MEPQKTQNTQSYLNKEAKGENGDGHWGGHLLGWALGIVCKQWVMRIYSWSQEHTVYTVC